MISELPKTGGIQSVEIAFSLIQRLCEAPGPVALHELASAMDMSKNKIYPYLVSLTRLGVLNKDGVTARYTAGTKLVELGQMVLNKIDVVTFAEPYLKLIKDELNETAVLSVWTQEGPMIVRMEQTSKMVNLDIRVGTKIEFAEGASGKIFAAYLDKELVDPLKGRELRKHNIRPQDFEKQLENVRRWGIAVNDEPLLPGISTMAAPVFDHGGKLVAAIAVLSLEQSIDKSPHGHPAEVVRSAAMQFSQGLGFRS
jgi:DNA-binding IclR family transcriptional regulator